MKRGNCRLIKDTTIMTTSIPEVYDALAALNRDFEQVLRDLQRIEEPRLFRHGWQRAFLKAWRATLEDPPPKRGTGMDPLRPRAPAGRNTIRVRCAAPIKGREPKSPRRR
jgi:hypothetical protein